MKKFLLAFLALIGALSLASCNSEKAPNNTTAPESDSTGPADTIIPSLPAKTEWDFKMKLPSTELLEEASNPGIVEGAPDIMIIGAILETYYFYNYETMSGFEYLKLYNNTNEDYNMKNHRIVLANPLQGQNYENEASKKGNEVLSTGFLFQGFFDEDFIIPAKSIGLVWLHPYYWTCGSGNKGSTGVFSPELMHADSFDQPGAVSQTMDDFKEFWNMKDSTVPVYKLTNMGLAGKMNMGGSMTNMYPIFSPGAGVPFTHLNPKLLRSLEIQKFNDQSGTASISLLNKYDSLSEEKKANPDPIYGKQAFNVVEIKDNGEAVDGYFYENAWKYFDPVCRINFCGRINSATMTPGQKDVSFINTSNPGVEQIECNVELQFRSPLPGERIMQWQLPLREKFQYDQYMKKNEYAVMRFSEENVVELKYIEKTIKLRVDPALGLELINWRTDELKSEGRMSCAAPTKIHTINVTAPKASNEA